jgi:CPA2 family monovalent cation:H+ antiporter-2
MHSLTFLEDLAVVMIVAGLVTILFHRLRQPVVLGYMIAGIIIGPHTPPFPLITDQDAIDTLAGLGIIFLMFSLGLEFNLRRLRRVGAAALVAAILEIVVMFWVGFEAGRLFGWSQIDSLFLGAMISISSTTIIVKALAELGRTKEQASQLIFGILVIEDLVGIAMIALLTGLATTGTVDLAETALTIGRLAIFVAALLVVGLLAVPRLLRAIARFRRDEVLLVAVLGTCFGISLLSAKLGYSVALGAFLCGAVIAESREIGRVQALTEPIRDMFSAVFFVAIGLLIDPELILTHTIPILILSLTIVLGKVLTCAAGTFLTGHDPRTSLRVGMGLAQIGEFSFIIAALGASLGVTGGFLYPIVVCVSAITTFLTPYFIRWSDPLAETLYRSAPRALLTALELYGRRVRELGRADIRPAGSTLARRLAWRLLLDLALVAAVFVLARVVGARKPGRLALLPEWLGGERTLLWAAALLLCLPILVVAFRNLRRLADLLGGMSAGAHEDGGGARNVRAIVSTTLGVAGTVGLGLFVLLLSSTLLPPWHVLSVLLILLVLLAVPGRRAFVSLYERAELALQDTPAAGLRIRELEIRSRTGASVVAIERAGRRIVNPAPDEELQSGDMVFLLGEPDQCRAARALLAPPTGSGAPPGSDPRG